MNRPSRSDDTTDHPTWNQNPPFLASDLTTCEDLNGKANAREHRAGCCDGATSESGLVVTGRLSPMEHVPNPGGAQGGSPFSGQGSTTGSCPASKEARTWAGARLRFPAASQSPVVRRSKAILSWMTWLLSVFAVSLLLSHIAALFKLIPFSSPVAPVGGLEVGPPTVLASPPTPSASASRFGRRESTCGSGNPITEEEYNTPLHVGGLVIILTISAASCAFCMIMKKVPRIRIRPNFFLVIRHFGTGVLIATAFVHLLPTAFLSLGDPCLPAFWTEDYPAMPGAIALSGVFFVTLIEMLLSPHRHIQPPRLGNTGSCCAKGDDSAATVSNVGIKSDCASPEPGAENGPIRDKGPLGGRTSSISRHLSRVASSDMHATAQGSPMPKRDVDVEQRPSSLDSSSQLTPEQQHKKDILQCMLLEMGILFHSIFIGITLALTIGNEFVILLIAISFHQGFEGLALGARIAAIDWPEKSWQPWLMCLAYGCTTPLGQAIGIGVHSLYDPEGEFGLVLVGTMNAISSGLLVYASLVELLSEDLLSDASWKELRGRKRVLACLMVLAGAVGMSLVGAWA